MKITDNTAGVLAEAQRLTSAGLEEIAQEVVFIAKRDVVVVSGDLQRSITAEVEDEKVVVGSPLVYAAKVEMDKPYLRPALEAVRATIKRIFRI